MVLTTTWLVVTKMVDVMVLVNDMADAGSGPVSVVTTTGDPRTVVVYVESPSSEDVVVTTE